MPSADPAPAGWWRHDGRVTQTEDRERPQLPPDPAAYDSPRAVRARAKGLDAAYIAGGNDPNPEEGLAQERRLGRLLIAMVVAIVASGFIVGTLLALAGLGGN